MILALMFLVHFAEPSQSAAGRWIVVNDGVMGGLSQSSLEVDEQGIGVFRGELSLENSGGFASIRSPLSQSDWSHATGLEIRAQGDGRRYQIRLRTTDSFDGIAYRAEFQTRPGEWIEFPVSFSEFEPTFRGRILRDAPPLDTASLQQIGFLLADKRPGPFRLAIDYVKAVGE